MEWIVNELSLPISLRGFFLARAFFGPETARGLAVSISFLEGLESTVQRPKSVMRFWALAALVSFVPFESYQLEALLW